MNIVPAEGDLERYPFSISRRGQRHRNNERCVARLRNECGQFLDQFDPLHHDVRLAVYVKTATWSPYEKKPNDSDLLVKAVEEHCQRLGQIPNLVAADAAFHSPSQKATIQGMGVKYISVPNRPTKNPVIRRIQKTRWFRKGQKWRTGCEGRISVLKRRHGLDRCRYRGQDGMNRWVGFGVIADNLINIGRALAVHA